MKGHCHAVLFAQALTYGEGCTGLYIWRLALRRSPPSASSERRPRPPSSRHSPCKMCCWWIAHVKCVVGGQDAEEATHRAGLLRQPIIQCASILSTVYRVTRLLRTPLFDRPLAGGTFRTALRCNRVSVEFGPAGTHTFRSAHRGSES